MANIFDYLDWRGDLSLSKSPFNEIDNLILARLSYFYFDDLMENEEEITIEEAYIRYSVLDEENINILQEEDKEFFKELSKAERFKNMKVTHFVNIIDEEEEKQFSAITILMPNKNIYVSFRGTDNTLVGWKEDFNMGFKMNVPSQLAGVKYLESIAKKYKREYYSRWPFKRWKYCNLCKCFFER